MVLHSISLPPGVYGGDAIERLFSNRLDCDAHPYYDALRGLRVSAHFLLRRDGRAQYATLARLLRALAAHYPIAEVVGHEDVAPGRKADPGIGFDWVFLRRRLRRRRPAIARLAP